MDKNATAPKLLMGVWGGGPGVGEPGGLHVTLRAATPFHLGSFGDWPSQDPGVPFWKEPPLVQLASVKLVAKV